MKKDDHFSEEQLNAFVDGELDPEEKSRLYNRAAKSPELDRRLCQQRKLKELVDHAYKNVPQPAKPKNTPLSKGGLLTRAVAAVALVVMGLTGGMLAHDYLDENQATVAPVAKVSNYLLHVTSGEPEQMLAALEQAQTLLESAQDDEARQVEIVANEQGLDLLRRDVTPYARQISALQDRDVIFYACSRTIERLRASGVDVVLVPETNTEYTALDRVVTRMQAGWVYEKI